MGRVSVNEARITCEALLTQARYEDMARVIEIAVPNIRSRDEWGVILELFERMPRSPRLESPTLAAGYASALVGNRLAQAVLEFTEEALRLHTGKTAAPLIVERSYALLVNNQYQEMLDRLSEAIPLLSGRLLGMAWLRFGDASFFSEQPWEDAFARARSLLTGRDLGYALLDEAYCLDQSKRGRKARTVWAEALSHFAGDVHLQALIRYNLGISALRDLEPEAERHFLEGMQLTRGPKAAGMRAPILNGLAASRRVLGEWARAESTYRNAISAAVDQQDLKEAHLGLARTLRLASRPSEALEVLELAVNEHGLDLPIVHVGRALAFLALNQDDRAFNTLGRVEHLASASDRWLERIARAELARREQRLEDVLNLLDGLPVQTLHAREEARQWPKLFEVLRVADRPVPEPLEYASGLVVRVTARGVLHVTVNGRLVPLAPTGRVGELLVFLLEQGGEASLDQIIEALFVTGAASVDRSVARKGLWKLVSAVRDTLGWKGSVRALRGAFQLDPTSVWEYDVREARASGAFHGEFLKGVYSDWALEVARELECLSDDAPFKALSSELN